MRKSVIGVIIAGGVLTIAGSILFGLGIAKEFKEDQLITHVFELSESTNNIKVDINTADIEFKHSTDGIDKVVVQEREKEYHDIYQEESTLFIENVNTKNWYERLFSFAPKKMNITVYLTNDHFNRLSIDSKTGDVTIADGFSFENASIDLTTGDVYFAADTYSGATIVTSTGNITVEDSTSSSASLSTSTGRVIVSDSELEEMSVFVSTGKVIYENLNVGNIDTGTTTGKINLNNVIAEGTINLHSTTGDINIVDSDASEVSLAATTGDISAVFLTNKIVFAETKTGDVNVPSLTTGGKCEVSTSTGDITISIKG